MWHLMLVWWDGEGVCIAHILLPKHHEKHSWDSKMNTLPHISCTDLCCPTQECELATYVHAHTHTSIQGASVTVNCDNNEWKPVLPPLLSLAVYYCVPPTLFCFSALIYIRKEWTSPLHFFLTSFCPIPLQLFTQPFSSPRPPCPVFYFLRHLQFFRGNCGNKIPWWTKIIY